jgi:hypothetical protein
VSYDRYQDQRWKTREKRESSNGYEVESIDGVGRVDKGKVINRAPLPKACTSHQAGGAYTSRRRDLWREGLLDMCRLDATQAGTAKCGVQAMSVDERDRRQHHRCPPPAL